MRRKKENDGCSGYFYKVGFEIITSLMSPLNLGCVWLDLIKGPHVFLTFQKPKSIQKLVCLLDFLKGFLKVTGPNLLYE